MILNFLNFLIFLEKYLPIERNMVAAKNMEIQ